MASFALVLIAGARQLSILAGAKLNIEIECDNALKG
jgi:DNA-directed RNA polymerase subunit K/omega